MQTDREAFLEFARGFAVGLAIVLGFGLIIGLIGTPDDKPAEKFKVVDTFKGCDVVRYTPDKSSKYAYFLHCAEVR